MRTLLTFLAATLALSLMVGPAPAAERAAARACRADFKKLCSGVKPGGGRGAECLKQHEAELSNGCKTAMAGAAQCVERARQICGGDGDAAARKACLKEHAAELAGCKDGG